MNGAYLDVVVEIPKVELSGPVYGPEDGRMFWVPFGIKDIVAGLLKRVQRRYRGWPAVHRSDASRCLVARLSSPQLDCPVYTGRQEQIGKVDGAVERVKVEACYRPGVAAVTVAVVEPRLGSSSIIPVGLVDTAFLGTHEESARLVVWEIHTGDRNFIRLVVTLMDQFEGFLHEPPLLAPNSSSLLDTTPTCG